MLSFIIPAHNEESLIGETLRILKLSADSLAEPYELIVVDDASSDETGRIARDAGAAVISIDRRQIAASRNAGAKAARGDVLIFVDADTHVPAKTLRNAIAAIRGGAVGGGARFVPEPGAPRWVSKVTIFTVVFMRFMRWAAGCFLFARRDAFEAVGGFDERYFATEEIVLSRALKKVGRMVIVSEPVVTSSRKARLYDLPHVLKLLWRLLWGGRRALQRREGLELWYEGRRE